MVSRSKLPYVVLILVGLVLVGAAAVDIVSWVAAVFGSVAILVGSADLWRTRRGRPERLTAPDRSKVAEL